MVSERYRPVVAAGAAIAASTPATAWVVGGFAGTASEFDDPDYMWEPVGFPDALVTAIGLLSIVVVTVAVVVVAGRLRRGSLDPRWLGVLVPTTMVAAYLGTTYAVATAPVIGANIGGGILVLFGMPVVVALLGVAGGVAHSIRRRPDPEIGAG